MVYGLAYLLLIVGVNFGFSYLPMIPTPVGVIPVMTIFVGAVFILRDFVQRAVGHWSLAYMAVGAWLSFELADPRVAIASVAAFAVAEGVEYLIFTITKKPFKDRMLLSVVLSVPVDSFIFLFGIGHLTVGAAIVMSLSKCVFALVLWTYYWVEDWIDENDEDTLAAADSYYDLTDRQH